jgi:hypothetical protein
LIISLLASAIAISASSLAAVMINEVMYNPAGDDNNHEYVELIGSDNLSGFVIGDNRSNDSLVLIKFVPGNLSLVVESGFNHSGLNCSIYSAGSTIGNNLNNKGDSVFIYSNSTLIDSVSYNKSLAGNNNRSLELVNGSWSESCSKGGSPCSRNCVIKEESGNDNSTGNNSAQNNSSSDEEAPEQDSSIIIVDIMAPSGGLHYGGYLEAEIYIYRGNTLKSAVTASLKDENNRKISDEVKFKLAKKYTELSTTAQFHIKEVCAEDKTYTLVVEGLGVSDEKEVRVWEDESVCREKEQTTSGSSTTKKAVSITSTTGISSATEKDCRIISFYTRTKNYKENITLYASTDCKEGELLLTGMMNDKRIIVNSSGTLSFEAEAKPGGNVFTLKLMSGGKLVDSRDLNVSLESEKEADEPAKKDSEEVVIKAERQGSGPEAARDMTATTGGVVYESSNVKLTKIAPMLGVGVVLLVVGGFVFLKRKEAAPKPPSPPKRTMNTDNLTLSNKFK